MKILISVSSKSDSSMSEYSTVKIDKSIYLYLNTLPPDNLKKLTSIRKVPYAKLTLDFKWDAGTEDEQTIPNLEFLKVPTQMQGKGIGEKLVLATLDFMRDQRIAFFMFNNMNDDFWKRFSKKYKGTVTFSKPHKGMIAYLHQKGYSI